MKQKKKLYNIIYADPPWKFKFFADGFPNRTAESHYRVQSLEDLKQMDIPSIMAKDAVLFMWATFPLLPDALDLGRAWGFNFRTVAFTWVKLYKHNYKPFIGMGYYTRANAEIVLLFIRGKPLKRQSNKVEQVLISKIGQHSQKPHEIRERIVQLYGDLPRVELFARSRLGFFPDEEYKGWDVFGDEANHSIEI
ncbi:hypothetical protein A9P82_12950 [Arachidicoccus ginsenosidimutans]|uniref:MT-A70 family methyltransferase n=1 Tax=Arachidicoccus sp. BS20 TaxID=1850526 RepID=UPI0007F17ACF|nr:MT-A70 family methyltransferase [Arachidicoccus sp. BS20]ANI90111.1 hypothetical protein A9P82_12950 [Arachidicoccus sp. BS20]